MKIAKKTIVLILCLVALVIGVTILGIANAYARNAGSAPVDILYIPSGEPPTTLESLCTPPSAPQLYVVFKSDYCDTEPVRAVQSSANWMVVNEDGEGMGFSSQGINLWDMNHRGLTEGIINLYSINGEIELYFAYNYPPDTVTVQRWTSAHVTSDFGIDDDIYNGAEIIEILGNTIPFTNYNGHDYIYKVYATWGNNNVTYYFRTIGHPAEGSFGERTKTSLDENHNISSPHPSIYDDANIADDVIVPKPYKVGRVTVISSGTEYEPFEHFMHGMAMTEGGMISALGIPLSLESVAEALPVIYFTDDFQVLVEGDYASSVGFSWYDSNFDQILSDTGNMVSPTDSGVYMLIIGVEWSNAENETYREFTFIRYIFMVMIP